MELTIHTETTIDSCHKLINYKGKCANLHGHTWLIELWFRGESKLKNKLGILVDFGIAKELKKKIDHQYLNNILDINPTAENISEWTYYWLKKHVSPNIKIKVRIYETAIGKKNYCQCGDFYD